MEKSGGERERTAFDIFSGDAVKFDEKLKVKPKGTD